MNLALDSHQRPLEFSPQERGPGAFLMSLLVHGLLFAMLWAGVAWKSSVPQTIEAELWTSIPQFAAPAPMPPAPVEPELAPAPKPPMPAPQPVQAQATQVPDIALERMREQKRKQQQAEQRELEQREQRRKDEAALKLKEKLQEQRLAQLAKTEQQRMLADAAREKEAQERHEREVASMLALAGKPSTGTASQTSGPRGSSTYISRVSQMIRGNTTYLAEGNDSNPSVEFLVRLDPAGGIMTLKKISPSGNPAFDDAVERAIRKTEPFPPDGTSVPTELRIVQRLKQ
jgi:colicin import membrane protein